MMVSAKAKVCGLMGCPVEHSLSPLMHNFFAEEMGIDFAYVPFRVEEGQVEAAVKGAYALNLGGMNVTVPYKQQVVPYLEELDDAAKAIGAVNTLVRVKGGYKGYNTDAPGLLRAMGEAGMDIGGKDWLLIGAGGAAKAAAFVLGSGNAASVIVLNRSRDKAEALARDMNRHFQRDFMQAMALKDYRALPDKEWQAVQTTSVGMYPHGHEAPVEDGAFYRNIKNAMDVVYTPARTRFMDLVEQAGGKAANGLDMLVYQGVKSFELWNPGQKVQEDVIAKARQLMGEALAGRS